MALLAIHIAIALSTKKYKKMSITYEIAKLTAKYDAKIKVNVPVKQGRKAYSYMREGKEKQSVLNDLNPTGSIFVGYAPISRVEARLGKNITTLAKTANKDPNSPVAIYRGAPKSQSTINNGDFITTNKQLAKDYAGNGHVLSQSVRYGDILDVEDEPLGEEYILRKGAHEDIYQNKKS